MGVYFRGGAVYGYKVDLDKVPDIEGVDPYWMEQAYALAQQYGVKEACEGDQMNGTPTEAVFYDEGNYFAGSELHNEQYGFFKIGATVPSEELQALADDYEGEWGAYGFFTVW